MCNVCNEQETDGVKWYREIIKKTKPNVCTHQTKCILYAVESVYVKVIHTFYLFFGQNILRKYSDVVWFGESSGHNLIIVVWMIFPGIEVLSHHLLIHSFIPHPRPAINIRIWISAVFDFIPFRCLPRRSVTNHYYSFIQMCQFHSKTRQVKPQTNSPRILMWDTLPTTTRNVCMTNKTLVKHMEEKRYLYLLPYHYINYQQMNFNHKCLYKPYPPT